MVKKAKQSYYSSIISENASDQKALFNTVDRLLYRKTDRQYPSCESSLVLCNNFSDFFVNKILKIRTEFPTFFTWWHCIVLYRTAGQPHGSTLLLIASFLLLKQNYVDSFLRVLRNLCCLDPIPTSFTSSVFWRPTSDHHTNHQPLHSHLARFRHPWNKLFYLLY